MDWNHVKQRRQQISDELVYVRMHPDVKVLESYVPLSAARGGNPNFRRDDLLYELTWEDKQLAMRSRLDALDRELHDAHATNKEYMEVRSCGVGDLCGARVEPSIRRPSMAWRRTRIALN